MTKAGRFVVEVHGHISTLYDSVIPNDPKWHGGAMAPGTGEVEAVDNSAFTLYEMDAYGVDMVLLYPSMTGTTNEAQLAICEKYPDKFRAFCCDGGTRLEAQRGGTPWTIERAADEVEACLRTGKYIGIGEHNPRDYTKQFPTAEERFNDHCYFFDLAQKYKVPISIHDTVGDMWDFDPWVVLSKLIHKYKDVKVVINHGGHSIGSYIYDDQRIRRALALAARSENVYLEVGTWTAEMIQIALDDPNVGPTQLLWGSDYGNVPQYLTVDSRRQGKLPTSFCTSMWRWHDVPDYQTDWWGWELHQINKLKDYYSQDELNLVLGGNAAKLFKLPVPFERMFLCGRPDINGRDFEKSVPYIPIEQVRYPDDKRVNKELLEARKKEAPYWGP